MKHAHPAKDRNLFRIEIKALDLNSQMLAAGKAHDKAERAMAEWHERNPRPLRWQASRDLHGNGSLYIAKGESEKAHAQYKKALAQWERREQKAIKACRFKEREAAWEESIDRISALCRRAENIGAQSIEGLRCKARLVELNGGDDPDLPLSIVNDLLAFPGGVS